MLRRNVRVFVAISQTLGRARFGGIGTNFETRA